ncbi:hypothetical protein MJ572_15425 [Escherichia coli]|nr:hypothetical protein MJ572_15425 [Escherichia coli]
MRHKAGFYAGCWAAPSLRFRPTPTRQLRECWIVPGISVTPANEAGCCGAVDYHLNAQEKGVSAGAQ